MNDAVGASEAAAAEQQKQHKNWAKRKRSGRGLTGRSD